MEADRNCVFLRFALQPVIVSGLVRLVARELPQTAKSNARQENLCYAFPPPPLHPCTKRLENPIQPGSNRIPFRLNNCQIAM